MDVSFRSVALNKRYPLRISRGEFSGSVNLFVSVGSGDLEGLGEAAPGSLIGMDTAESFQVELTSFLEDCPEALDNPHEGWQLARSAEVTSCAWAAVDIALWDLLAKRARVPL